MINETTCIADLDDLYILHDGFAHFLSLLSQILHASHLETSSSLKSPDDKSHSGVHQFRKNISQMVVLTRSGVANLESRKGITLLAYVDLISLRILKFPGSWLRKLENRVLTGSPFAQTCNTFGCRAVGNLSPNRPSRRLGSPNMTTDLIFGNSDTGSLSAARCMMLAPCE
jgi:hypothetical protein